MVLRWWGLLSLPVYEIMNEGSEMWEFVGQLDQTAPTVEGTPCDDGKLYDLIFLLRQVELHDVYML